MLNFERFIIILEDTTLHYSVGPIMWMTCAYPEWQPLKKHINWLLSIVKYLAENANRDIYLKSDFKIEINKSNNLSFDLKKNLETDSTEFYNLAYNYVNDCLRAGLVYRREFYTDRDIEASDTLMFNVSLFPFGGLSLPTIDR